VDPAGRALQIVVGVALPVAFFFAALCAHLVRASKVGADPRDNILVAAAIAHGITIFVFNGRIRKTVHANDTTILYAKELCIREL
jgi:hypothetical protein